MDKIILWGAGRHSKAVLSKTDYPIGNIEVVVDSDINKYETFFFGVKVDCPNNIYKYKSSIVVVGTDTYFKEVKNEIDNMGLNKKVYSIDDYLKSYSGVDNPSTRMVYQEDRYRELERQLSVAQGISQLNLQNTKVLSGRDEALKYIPKGGVVAEVGVAYGDFSDKIISICEPSHFYAIDYFNKDNPFISFWGKNYFLETGLTHEEWYKKRFEKLIHDGKMTICSGLSWDCLSEFPDNFFDYIYVDACHEYMLVKKDIEVAKDKIKDGGIMQFNDYTLYDICTHDYYGVVPAVNEFIRDSNSQVLFYCLNPGGFDDIVVKVNK